MPIDLFKVNGMKYGVDQVK
jgi:hypothetical protein